MHDLKDAVDELLRTAHTELCDQDLCVVSRRSLERLKQIRSEVFSAAQLDELETDTYGYPV